MEMNYFTDFYGRVQIFISCNCKLQFKRNFKNEIGSRLCEGLCELLSRKTVMIY